MTAPLRLQDLNEEVTDAVHTALKQFIDLRCRHLSRHAVITEIGKSLIALGGMYIGKTIQNLLGVRLDADTGMAPVAKCLREYKEMMNRLLEKDQTLPPLPPEELGDLEL